MIEMPIKLNEDEILRLHAEHVNGATIMELCTKYHRTGISSLFNRRGLPIVRHPYKITPIPICVVHSIMLRYDAGESLLSIGKSFDMSKRTVSALLRNNDINVYNKRVLSNELIESMRVDYNNGMSGGQIAQKYKITISTTYSRFHKKNIQLRRYSRAMNIVDEETAAYNRAVAPMRRNAKLRGLQWELSDTEAKQLILSNCHYCGAKPSNIIKKYNEYKYNGIDRKNNTVGYIAENVVPACYVCNRAKGTMSYESFINWIACVARHMGCISD